MLVKKRKRGDENKASLGLGNVLTDQLIRKALLKASKAHKSPKKLYLVVEPRSLSNIVIFSFPGCWSVNDWYTGDAFGQKKNDRQSSITKTFPSLKSIATEEVATVNAASLERFQKILPRIEKKVDKYVKKEKQIVFTGHSSGGPVAILMTVWLLEQLKRPETNNKLPPLCITFGSPLVGDRIFNHALSRENWSRYFTHFVMRYDIIPRLLLSPLSSIKQELVSILHFLKPKSLFKEEPSREASTLYETVMRNVSSLASHAARQLMGNTYILSETLTTFIEFSPYRPSGNYVFCTGNEELVVVKSPDDVLQILLYAFQLQSEQERPGIGMRSIKNHQNYQSELQSLEKQNVIQLDSLEELPLSSDCKTVAAQANDRVLNNLGLSSRARLCLYAAREFKKQKSRNMNIILESIKGLDSTNKEKVDDKKTNIETVICKLELYKAGCENRGVSYYDAFKISSDKADFNANVDRLKLAGIFDELMEMIKKYELPDEFEGIRELIDIGTRYRRLVEPLDIANYYRHLKNADTGSYMEKGRPKRYRFTQKWLEYAEGRESGSSLESCFWAEVEELDICLKNSEGGLPEDVEERISNLEKNVEAWVSRGELGRDVFFKDSTFVKWWETLQQRHGLGLSFSRFINQ